MSEDFQKKLAEASWPVDANLAEAKDAGAAYAENVEKFGKAVHEHATTQLQHSADALSQMPTDEDPRGVLELTQVVPLEDDERKAGAA